VTHRRRPGLRAGTHNPWRYLVEKVSAASPKTRVLALWVPARRPGRRGWIASSQVRTSLHSRGTLRPSFTKSFARKTKGAVPSQEGGRESRVRAAPAISCAKAERKTHTSIQVQRKQSGLPCAMVLRLISCSPWRPAFLSPSSPRSLLLKNLTPASGRRDHTTSPSALTPFVKGVFASTASRPASVTIASRPSVGRDNRDKPVIWARRQAKFRKIRN
jgi:hypothetical protein